MGSNMQRQAVPCLRPEKPLVGTGIRAHGRGGLGPPRCRRCAAAWSTTSTPAASLVRVNDDETVPGDVGVDIYNLVKYTRSNQNTNINQTPLVKPGERHRQARRGGRRRLDRHGRARAGAEHAGRVHALERLQFRGLDPDLRARVADDRYTSIHIEELTVVARDTKLGPEEITRDISNLSEGQLARLDESGIVYIGAEVEAGDVLVGKVTAEGRDPAHPRGEAAARHLRREGLRREGHVAAGSVGDLRER